MSTTWKLFIASAAFSLATVIAYFAVSTEPAGTALLGAMSIAPAIVAGYLLLSARRRNAAFEGDDPNERPEDAAGRSVGVFVARSAWPLVLAGGLTVAGAGLVYGLWLLVPGIAISMIAVVGLMRESSG